MFINALDPAINILVAHYREQHPKVSYLELTYFAGAKVDALCARNPGTGQKTQPEHSCLRRDQLRSLLEPVTIPIRSMTTSRSSIKMFYRFRLRIWRC